MNQIVLFPYFPYPYDINWYFERSDCMYDSRSFIFTRVKFKDRLFYLTLLYPLKSRKILNLGWQAYKSDNTVRINFVENYNFEIKNRNGLFEDDINSCLKLQTLWRMRR